METYTRRSRIQSLKAELQLRQQACATLQREFEKRRLSYEEQSDLFRRWEDALKESQLVQALLQMLEREEQSGTRLRKSQESFQNAQYISSVTWFYHAKE